MAGGSDQSVTKVYVLMSHYKLVKKHEQGPGYYMLCYTVPRPLNLIKLNMQVALRELHLQGIVT